MSSQPTTVGVRRCTSFVEGRKPSWNRDFNQAGSRSLVDRRYHVIDGSLDPRPVRCGEYDDRYATTGEVLLMLEVRISSDKDVESISLGRVQQCSVCKP
jgi:hypothetical protein